MDDTVDTVDTLPLDTNSREFLIHPSMLIDEVAQSVKLYFKQLDTIVNNKIAGCSSNGTYSDFQTGFPIQRGTNQRKQNRQEVDAIKLAGKALQVKGHILQQGIPTATQQEDDTLDELDQFTGK